MQLFNTLLQDSHPTEWVRIESFGILPKLGEELRSVKRLLFQCPRWRWVLRLCMIIGHSSKYT